MKLPTTKPCPLGVKVYCLSCGFNVAGVCVYYELGQVTKKFWRRLEKRLEKWLKD
jgi:hypothetical protein